eukprot:scaffold219806_cov33-Tisochrysis_lutea.AAC.1
MPQKTLSDGASVHQLTPTSRLTLISINKRQNVLNRGMYGRQAAQAQAQKVKGNGCFVFSPLPAADN